MAMDAPKLGNVSRGTSVMVSVVSGVVAEGLEGLMRALEETGGDSPITPRFIMITRHTSPLRYSVTLCCTEYPEYENVFTSGDGTDIGEIVLSCVSRMVAGNYSCPPENLARKSSRKVHS